MVLGEDYLITAAGGVRGEGPWRADGAAMAARSGIRGQGGVRLEGSGSSLDPDRIGKGRIYARNNIPVHLVINLTARPVEVFTDPEPQVNPKA